ncbi:hypothetical protein [Leptolyngbya sp. 7M]|uniref:hypothetical protein n=1 Tax=Leptolyngbya sp. 7M TaxID=2812896 RepID=UPI001B8C093B|nr:hypothetical protein [Leptolyngbya sp. 7M]QYO67317.1 hypothetical protein JVX88_11230 [Leptolyngbya sp. 7M]
MKRLSIFLLLLMFCSMAGLSQEPVVTPAIEFRIESAGFSGTLYLRIVGEERKVADGVVNVWIINEGKEVVYSTRGSAFGGAGGFEDEGHALWIYETRAEKKRKIMSQYYIVDALMPVTLSSGETPLLVRMSDGGLGASYFSVVDPKRGEVFFRKWAELLTLEGDNITLGVYSDYLWGDSGDPRDMPGLDKHTVIPPRPGVMPNKTETHDLKKIFRNRVIKNRPTFKLEVSDGN